MNAFRSDGVRMGLTSTCIRKGNFYGTWGETTCGMRICFWLGQPLTWNRSEINRKEKAGGQCPPYKRICTKSNFALSSNDPPKGSAYRTEETLHTRIVRRHQLVCVPSKKLRHSERPASCTVWIGKCSPSDLSIRGGCQCAFTSPWTNGFSES